MSDVIDNKLMDIIDGHINNNDNKNNIIKVYNSYSKNIFMNVNTCLL
jgi:hypothetical protein